jgi:hypothetical protein
MMWSLGLIMMHIYLGLVFPKIKACLFLVAGALAFDNFFIQTRLLLVAWKHDSCYQGLNFDERYCETMLMLFVKNVILSTLILAVLFGISLNNP